MARTSFKFRKVRRVSKHPLAEVFGFPTDNQSPEAVRHRSKRLCPFNSRTSSQLTLFELSLSQAVNVASVPQRSPFRYPGGKTWLVPRIRQWLKQPVREFIEPFAGGGIVSLTVAAEKLADHLTLV